MSTEDQITQDIISNLLALQRGEQPPGVTISPASARFDLCLELPPGMRDAVQQQITEHMARVRNETERRVDTAVSFLMAIVLELAEEYERACPGADTAGFIRDFIPRPKLQAV